jgi:uncharacterized protein
MEPVPPPERIPVIDVLRGVALAGIIVANLRGLGGPMEAYLQPSRLWAGAADRAAQCLVDVLVGGKFIALFAMLFGLGFGVQSERAARREEVFAAVWVRRMAVLALFGAGHVLLLWWGDILFVYAAAGLVLLAFRAQDQRGLAFWAILLYLFPLALFAGLGVLGGGAPPAPPGPEADPIARSIGIYTRGGFGAQLALRWREWLDFNASAPYSGPRILGFFLFGFWLWRERFFLELESHRARLRRWWPWLLAAGLAGNGIYVAVNTLAEPDLLTLSGASLAVWTAASLGIPALSLFYASAVILLHSSGRWGRLLAPFGAVGRMALTNYLAQSAIGALLFHGGGLGLYGRVGPAVGLPVALAIYALQAGFSGWWLARFRYGPAEWAWRRLTYGPARPDGRAAGLVT